MTCKSFQCGIHLEIFFNCYMPVVNCSISCLYPEQQVKVYNEEPYYEQKVDVLLCWESPHAKKVQVEFNSFKALTITSPKSLPCCYNFSLPTSHWSYPSHHHPISLDISYLIGLSLIATINIHLLPNSIVFHICLPVIFLILYKYSSLSCTYCIFLITCNHQGVGKVLPY